MTLLAPSCASFSAEWQFSFANKGLSLRLKRCTHDFAVLRFANPPYCQQFFRIAFASREGEGGGWAKTAGQAEKFSYS
jgi:hypothetical protein